MFCPTREPSSFPALLCAYNSGFLAESHLLCGMVGGKHAACWDVFHGALWWLANFLEKGLEM